MSMYYMYEEARKGCWVHLEFELDSFESVGAGNGTFILKVAYLYLIIQIHITVHVVRNWR